jgi:hypothetical protein
MTGKIVMWAARSGFDPGRQKYSIFYPVHVVSMAHPALIHRAQGAPSQV